MRRPRVVALGIALLVGGLAHATVDADATLLLPLPGKRPPTGTAIVARIGDADRPARQDALTAAVLGGQIPRFLRSTVPVRYVAADASGSRHVVELSVAPDYLAVGIDTDFVRVALDRSHAEAVTQAAGGLLPTRLIVDRIYEAANVRVDPRPIPPSSRMVTLGVLLEHRELLRAQDLARPSPRLRAGHKKDVVLTPRLAEMPDRIAIYGWHRDDGDPIQPLSLVHGATYADYSHGIRVVAGTARVDGQAVALTDLLTDPTWWPLVSDEGPLPADLLAP